MDESFEIAEASITGLQTEVEELKTQHEDEVSRIRAAQLAERRQDVMDVSALKSRDQILTSQVERLSKDLTMYKNKSEQSEMKIHQLQLAIRSKEDLIRALETNLKLRSSPKNSNLANCQVCPGLKSKLEDSELRIQTLIRDHAQELLEKRDRVEHEWKEQCQKLEAVSSGAHQEVEISHQKLYQADEEIKELTSAIRDLKVRINDKDGFSAVRDQIEHFLTRVRDFKQLHEIPDYEILEAVDRRITESNHPKVSIWWAQKNKKSPFKSWEQAQIALRQTFVDKARLTTVKVFTERGQQQRDESLRKFATRLHEAAQETSVPDATAVDIFLSGAYDKSRISSLQNAENPPKTLDECINYLRRRDIDVEITPEKEERSRSASPKSARMPARGQISSKPESVSWEGPVAELRRENQLMEARMMQKIPTVIASLMTTTQTNVQAPSSGGSNSGSPSARQMGLD
ncbi:unnamed protein product [Aphanomyces euteiches]